jgi:DNA-directed RNA polymerase specialized sigma24 family protein
MIGTSNTRSTDLYAHAVAWLPEVRGRTADRVPVEVALVDEAAARVLHQLSRRPRPDAVHAWSQGEAAFLDWLQSRIFTEVIATWCGTFGPMLTTAMRKDFGGVSHQVIDDAVQVTLEFALNSPDAILSVLLTNGANGVFRYLRTVCWRTINAEYKRTWKRWADESVADHQQPTAPKAAPIEVAPAEEQVLALLREAARRRGHGHVEEVYQALVDNVLLGENATVAAEKHGIPREYVSRCRSWLRTKLSADVGEA